MGRRRGGSIYVSTDPNVVLEIGTPGVSTSIGPLGNKIYAPQESVTGAPFITGDLPSVPVTTIGYSANLPIVGGTAPYTLTTATGVPADFAAAISGNNVQVTSAFVVSLPGNYPLTFQVTDANSLVSPLYGPILTVTA